MKITADFTNKLKDKFRKKGIRFSKSEISTMEEMFVETLFEEIAEGKKIGLLNVGILSSSIRTMKIKNAESENGFDKFERFVISFRTSKKLKDKINEQFKEIQDH